MPAADGGASSDPSNDKAKIAAAVSVFQRFAAESVGFTNLAHSLNGLGYRNGCGGYFQHQQIEEMLADPIYLGFYTWNKWHFGKFRRFTKGQAVPELNYKGQGSRNAKEDWVQSGRLFEPIVDPAIWSVVQGKLAQKTKRNNTPRSATQYLAWLVHCAHCGTRMVAGPTRKPTSRPRKDGSTGERHEYRCGTYFKAVREKRRAECKCLRNGVFQDTLEEYVTRYLDETGQRLELLTGGLEGLNMTERLEGQEAAHWRAFRDGITRLTSYLAQHHPDDYAGLLQEFAREHEADDAILAEQAVGGTNGCTPSLAERFGDRLTVAHKESVQGNNQTVGTNDFVEACLACYRSVFDPAGLEAEVQRLDAEHTALVEKWGDLPTTLAKQKAKERLIELEARIERLQQQQQDAGEVVAASYRQMHDLQVAIADARLAMRGQALGQRAEALRKVIHRIECTFTATGHTGGGWGKANSRLVAVKFYPVVGEPVEFSASSNGTVQYSSAHSFMNLTRFGWMR